MLLFVDFLSVPKSLMSFLLWTFHVYASLLYLEFRGQMFPIVSRSHLTWNRNWVFPLLTFLWKFIQIFHILPAALICAYSQQSDWDATRMAAFLWAAEKIRREKRILKPQNNNFPCQRVEELRMVWGNFLFYVGNFSHSQQRQKCNFVILIMPEEAWEMRFNFLLREMEFCTILAALITSAVWTHFFRRCQGYFYHE